MNTRLQILLAAEKLFAERGIDAVSMREVNRAAGQRNTSALHYHYGSMDGLLGAIVSYRMEPVNERRLEILSDGDRDGRVGDIQFLAESMVRPLVEIVETERTNYWIRFLAQIYSSSRFDLAALVRRKSHDTSLRLLAKYVRAAAPEVPRELMNQRLVVSMRQVVHALADCQRGVLARQGGASVDNFDLFAANLVDLTAGALVAPVSKTTRLLFEQESEAPERVTGRA